MAAPFNNLRSKNDRAICAYLISAHCGGVNDILPHESTADRTYPNTTIRSIGSKPETNFTGSRRITVRISVKGSATQNPGDTKEQARENFDQRVSSTYDALMQTDDEQTLTFTAEEITTAGRALAVDASNGADPVQVQQAEDNADMADYTCQQWYEGDEGDVDADAEGCDWEVILMFYAVACASAVN